MILDFFIIRKKFCQGLTLALTISIFLFCQFNFPEKLFSQTRPDSLDQGPLGASRRVLDYQFDRADRELSPGRWMEEARQGIMIARSVWAEMAPDIFLDPEAQAEFTEWSEQELENRFTRWLLERFFGTGIEVPAAAVFRETSEADKYLIYSIGPDGNILYDPRTGDPKVIRPGDEDHDFAGDLLSWKQTTQDAADREVQGYSIGVKENYPELLIYISSGREGEFERKLATAGDRAVLSLKHEFEAILAREERYFTAQRLGDVWSLRKRSEDQSAEAVGEKLIDEARRVCADGIASIEARIEAAKGDGADLVLTGTQWLEEYREQFQRGLKAWESAEESFLIRRIEWERSAEKAFYEGREIWDTVFIRFEEERRNWEEKARILFFEGEQFFAQASKTLEIAINAARTEFERESQIRMEAASERTGALTNMYVLSGSAVEEARKNIDFWIGRYREIKPGVIIPGSNADFEAWIDGELLLYGGAADSLEGLILEELKTWSILYQDYTAKTEESREQLIKELYSLTGYRDDPEFGNIFNPNNYETELIRLEGELEYWESRTALSEAVAAYAEALDAGRITAAESTEAWEKARTAYDEAAALYGEAEGALKAAGDEISSARDALVKAAETMRAADSALEKLRQNYQALTAASGNRGSAAIADDLAFLKLALLSEQELLGSAGETSPWGKFLACARELETQQFEEIRREILGQLIAGDGENFEALAVLARNAENTGFIIDEAFLGLAETLRGEGKISQGQYNLLLSTFEDNASSLAENQLSLRLAALSLILGNGSTADWYFSVYNLGNEETPGSLIPDMEKRLLSDWERDNLNLLKARAGLELEALDFLQGKETGEAAAILASLYTGDEVKATLDREALEQILDLLQLFEERMNADAPGDFYKFLTGTIVENERVLSFLSGYCLINPLYGLEISEVFLVDYVRREEFSRGLYNIYMSFGDISPAIARDDLEQGFRQLRLLWGTLGIETENSVFPGTETTINAIKEGQEDSASELSLFLLTMDEIFEPLPSWLDLSFSMWKESLVNYYTSPSEDTLVVAERNTDHLNSALFLLKNQGQTPDEKDFEKEAARYLIDPLLEWNENDFASGLIINYENYEVAFEELLEHYSVEMFIKGEIERLSALVDISMQGIAAMEGELGEALAAITRAEGAYKELTAAYQEAAYNFQRAGVAYDSLYANVEWAFKNLESARRAFDTQDALRMWAETAYLDSRRPVEELRYCLERRDRAEDALEMLKSLNHDSSLPYSAEYEDAFTRYKESLSLFTLSLDVLYHLERAVDAEQKKNESAYWVYQNQLSLFGKSFYPEEDYVSPEDKDLWKIEDVVVIDNGFLVFSRDGDNILSGSDEQRSEMLREYFTSNKTIDGESYLVSSFELALRELRDNLAADNLSKDGYKKLGLARDYLIRQLVLSNPDITKSQDWYRTAESLRSDQNLGKMPLRGPYRGNVSGVADNFRKYIETMQLDAWNSLDEATKRDLEFYTIITILNGTENISEYFSRITEYYEYELTYSFVDQVYKAVSHMASVPIFGLAEKNNAAITKATRKSLAVPRNELNNYVTLGFNGFKETLSSLENKLNDYRGSSERLSILKAGNGDVVSWQEIEKALDLAGNLDGYLDPLRELWDQISVRPGNEFNDVPSALRMLAQTSKNLKEEATGYLYQVWKTGDEERSVYELTYRELYNAYMAGQADLKDLQAAAVLCFEGAVPFGKQFLGDTGAVIMENLRRFMERELGGTAEYAMLAGEFSGIIADAWEGKYTVEQKIRENEWDLQRRDIQEKLSLWRESAEAILELGRMSWKEGDEKLREACNLWAKTYEEEYGRIKDQWTAAYLEGLQDKEAWAASALEAASEASSAAVLAMIGSGAEAGARAMATRDPLGFMNLPDMREGERILADLLEKSGVGNLTAAFGSIRGSRETFATTVRIGLGGGGIWNSGVVLTEASNFARTVREEFETRESRKMAYTVLDSSKEAYKMLEDKLYLANESFRKSMDELFIIGGQWRRTGTGYIKDVIVHSTLFDAVITEGAEVEKYRNYLLPQTRLSVYLYSELPQNLNVYQAESLIDTIYSEIIELNRKVFGSDTGEDGGEFMIHLGNQPNLKSSPDPEKGRSGVFIDRGDGELGRLLTEFYFYMCKEQLGIAMVSMAPWDKPIWDSRGSSISAPSLRSAVDVAIQTGLVIAGAAGAVFTGGASLVGSIALSVGLNSADDLLFAVLDVSGGYKSWEEAGVQFGKQLLTNTVSAAASSFFYGVNGLESSGFLSKGGFSGLVSGEGFSGAAFKTLTTGLYSVSTGTVNSLIASVTYDDNGFGFSGETFLQSLKNSGQNVLSSMTGTFISSILDVGLTGFVKDLYKDGQKLDRLAGSLASQAVNYAFGNDFTLNLLNVGMFFDEKTNVNAGLVEMHLGRNGLGFELGSGGADVSIGSLWSAVKGLETWKVNGQLYLSAEDASHKYTRQMRTLYSMGGENRDEYDSVLAGKTVYEERRDTAWTKSVYDEATGIKTVYLGADALNDTSPFGLNVFFSHEAYRDGIIGTDYEQNAETQNAVLGHAETALAIIETYGNGSLGEWMSYEALSYALAISTGDMGSLQMIIDCYDSSDDYWKLVRNENNAWAFIPDGSPDFDISDLLRDKDFQKRNSSETSALLDALFKSGLQDGKGFGIISAGRMTPEMADALGYVAIPKMNTFVSYSSDGLQTITPEEQRYNQALNGLIKDTLEKIAYNEMHTTTVYDKLGRPIALFNMDSGNFVSDDLLKQSSSSLSNIPNMAKSGCNFMDIISIPQLLTIQVLNADQITEIWNQALEKDILRADGYVKDRNALANLALQKMGISNFGIELSGTKPNNAALAGYRVEVPYGNGGHFVLTGIDKSLIYNPGRTFTSNQSLWRDILEVYVYAK